jgi:hypothetical protein
MNVVTLAYHFSSLLLFEASRNEALWIKPSAKVYNISSFDMIGIWTLLD